MDLKQLEYFVRVEECGSFSAAAGVLRVAQPSLSRQIRLLELELNHDLFIRHGRGVIVTEAGRVLAEQARLILRQVDLAREALERLNPGLTGRLAVGMPSSLIGILGVPLFTEFKSRLPGIGLSISDGLSISLHEWLLAGRLDIALLYKPLPSSDVRSIPVLDEELLLFSCATRAETDEPIELAQVAELPLILPRRPHEIRTLTERQMAGIGCKPKIALEVDSIPAILEFLSVSDHYAILPRYAVSIYSKRNAYLGRTIANPGLCSKLVLATAAKRATNILCDQSIKLIVEVCDDVLDPIRTLGRAAVPAL
jgi:LysR family transcriptional regulator, nitrogen assimilation regulatory protein